ncbi:MAG: alanine racemase, partial [candidate division Zixibacteria bacterium]|nr:alanine racemase [candidate division Zixibacteria bacterium]
HPPLDFEVPAVIQWRLSPTVSDEATAQILSRNAQGATVPVHVEINTGLNRLGLDWQQASDVIARIAALPGPRIAGVFTHFRAAFSEGDGSVRQQMERFDRVMADLAARGIEPGLRHAASSIAMAFYPDTYLDGVRPGMMVYGGMKPVEPAHATPSSLLALRPVMAARTRIIHVKSVAAGEWIHYGETFQAQRPMRAAVLPIGYGMGYSRHLSNNGEVLIGGRRVPIVGVIGMDMTVVDVTSLPSVAVGDVATVLGRDGGDEITAVELAERIGTISYEITCRLGNALPRYVVGESVAEAAAPVGLVSTKRT